MLVIMTYNAYLYVHQSSSDQDLFILDSIAAVLGGAFVGHFFLHRELPIGSEEEDRGMACH